MGTILTDYGDLGYEHEGYPAQLLNDGSATGTPSPEKWPRMTGQLLAACSCGWIGLTPYPARQECDEDAEALALYEWEHIHARPVLERAQQSLLAELEARLHSFATRDLPPIDRPPAQLAGWLETTVASLEAATATARDLLEQALAPARAERDQR